MTTKKNTIAIILLTGLVGLLLQVLAGFFLVPFDLLFGNMWMTRARDSLMNAGLSEDFVCGYVTFALLDVGMWLVLIIITFCLGFSTRRWPSCAAILLSAWMPVMAVVYTVLFWVVCPPSRLVLALSSVGVHVAYLCSFPVGMLGWYLGRVLGSAVRRVRKSSDSEWKADKER